MRHIALRKLMRMNLVTVAKKSILFLVGSSCNTKAVGYMTGRVSGQLKPAISTHNQLSFQKSRLVKQTKKLKVGFCQCRISAIRQELDMHSKRFVST